MNRFYAWALFLLPREIRDRHGREMAAVFEQLLRDRRRRRGKRGVLTLTARELTALLWFAWCAHRGGPAPPRIDERMLTWTSEPDRRLPMRESVVQDVTYAIRMLRRTPGFTVVCVLTMALAIGANTAVFSLVHGVLLKPLPFPDGDRLVVLGHHTDGQDAISSTTPGNFYDWQARATAFEGLAGFAYTARIVSRGDFAERVTGAVSVGSVFDVLGRGALEGRTFIAAEDTPGAPAVVVLSQGLSRRLFGERSSVGESIQIGGAPYTVVGVMPPDFAFPDYDAEYWIPAGFDAKFRQNRDQYFLLAVARLRAGVTVEQSRVQLDTVMDAIRRDHPQFTQNATAAVFPLKTFLTDGFETRLWMLLGAVVLVLLIACANIANLLLARGTGRRREMALRHAVGARPQRLVRQMLTESVLLAGLGGAAGIVVGSALVKVLVSWLPDNLPRAGGVGVDTTVLAMTATVVVACGVAFGLWPSLQLSTGHTAEALRQGARETGRSDRVRTALVVAEVALALIVLAGAGLLARSFGNLRDVRPGFEPSGLLTFSVSLPGVVYRSGAERYAYFERALRELRALPGVNAAALSTTVPVAGRGTGAWFNILDRPLPDTETPPAVPYRIVSPDYLAVLGIPITRGRALSEDDAPGGPQAVVISEAVARRFWPDGTALGKRIYLGAPNNRLIDNAEIVGIAGDVKQAGLDERVSEAVYVPHRLMPSPSTLSFVLRTAVPPSSVVAAARETLRQIDASIPLHTVRTMDEIVSTSLAPARSSLYLLGVFAAMALLLSVVGVFGVMSYTVSQRRAEMAIRLALGAPAPRLLLLMLGRGMRHVAIGIAVGLALSLPGARYIQSLLFNVEPADPVTLAAVATLLTVVAAVAVYLPSRRATRVDPATTLRDA